jgi:acetyl esterase/lipase
MRARAPWVSRPYSSTLTKLDVYYPQTSQIPKSPVLFFIYGGGFNTGEKSISPKTFGLVYANVAAYFARRGHVVVIPDYRLVPHVIFPGPAEDVRDALRWVIENPECLVSEASPHPDLHNIVMLGHSAGAAHIATMLFSTDVLPADDPLRDRIEATVLESPPYDLSAMTMEWPTADIHAEYWVTLEKAKENDPWHLFQRLDDKVVAKLPRILMLEFEPEWLSDAGKVFHKEVKDRTGKDLRVVIAKGHNHISMNWALSTGEGEEWAEEVVEWLDKVRIASICVFTSRYMIYHQPVGVDRQPSESYFWITIPIRSLAFRTTAAAIQQD